MTRVGIGIPVFETRPEFLATAIDSALDQRGSFDLQLVVIDDGSTTDYGPVMTRFAGGPVRYRRNPARIGMVGNWNAVVRQLDADYAMVLGHDDVLVPGMIAAYLHTAAANEGIVLCSCAREFVDESGRVIRPRRRVNDRANIFREPGTYLLSHDEVLRLCLRNGNPIGEPSALLFRRDLFDAVDGFDPAFAHAADVDFIVRLSRHGRVAYHNRVLLRRRVHAGSLTVRNVASGEVTRERALIHERYLDEASADRRRRAELSTFLVAASMRDLARAVTRGRWAMGRAALQAIREFASWRPGPYLAYAAELLSGRNRDAEWVPRLREAPPARRPAGSHGATT